jgi:1-aminocyclopropane-1-carboxylate deaminase/D-cysteine desulfhydrase-like pyridoxal-dependent ACC family enzyme
MASWTPDLPRFRIIDGPSRVHPLPRFSASLSDRAEIWIKREDLLPLAFGGNKLRNLEFLVGAAQAEGADSLVTEGRRWSNHCRLTAAAGAKAGLDVHLVLSGPPRQRPGANERLAALLGATIHVALSAASTDRVKLAEQITTRLREDGRRPYRIAVGGGGVSGAVGQVLAGQELARQGSELRVSFDAVVLPSATGGTQAGVLAGLRLEGSAATVIGIAVAHPAAKLRPSIEALLAGVGELTGTVVDPGEIELDDRHRGAGYGRVSDEATDAARLLARTEGVLVDPIYTAKALAGLVDLVRSGVFDGKRVVFWHAGGTPGLFEDLD